MALDGKHAAFSELYELGSPVAVPPTPSHRSGQWAMGAFGVVYVAKHRATHEVVGVKLTKSKQEEYIDGEGCRRVRWNDRYAADSHHHCLLEEAHVHRKASALGSRHVCRLQGAYEVPVELSALVRAGEDEPGARLRLALVLEFFPGQNLRHVVTQSEKLPGVMTPQTPGSPRVRAYSEVDKRNMFAPIAQALMELHRAGIVHRDIKRAFAGLGNAASVVSPPSHPRPPRSTPPHRAPSLPPCSRQHCDEGHAHPRGLPRARHH